MQKKQSFMMHWHEACGLETSVLKRQVRTALTRGEVLPGGGQGWLRVGAMRLVGGTIMLMLVVAMKQLPVRSLLQVVCQRHLINGPMRAHNSLCMARCLSVS